jgi:hypothetical protein
VFAFISDHIGLFYFWEHFVLVLSNEIDIDIDHLIVLAVDVDSVESGVFVVVDDTTLI